MNLILSITSPNMDAEKLHKMAVDLCGTLLSEASDIYPELMVRNGIPGSKGEPLSSTLVITFLSSSAAVALVNVIKSYVVRDSSLEMVFSLENRGDVSIRVNNMNIDQTEDLIRKIKVVVEEFLEDSHD